MTKPEAREILDAARAGVDVPTHRITEALCATGDLSRWRAAQMPVEAIELEAA